MLTLADARRSCQPKIPSLLSRPLSVAFQTIDTLLAPAEITSLFPLTSISCVIQGIESRISSETAPSKIGVVFSGGPAPGGHNVVAGIFDTLCQMTRNSSLIGFLGGPGAIVSGSYIPLDAAKLKAYRNQGGFDLLGSGRTKIETPDQFQAVLAVVSKLKLSGLIIIGGDDSNTNAAHLAEYFLKEKSATCVIGVPKTIDGDIQNPYVPISFGFDTASKIYSEMIGNLAQDTLSSLKYFHFVKLMGRSASHLTLECALKTQSNITLISEERKSFKMVVEELTRWVQMRTVQKMPYGIVLVPEGLLETMPDLAPLFQAVAKTSPEEFPEPLASTWHQLPERIQKQLLIDKDPHGNVNLSAIETELLLMEAVQKQLKKNRFEGVFQPLAHFYGYEGRCGHPSNFDANYSYALGCTAALLAVHRQTAQMAYVKGLHLPPSEWTFGGVPLPSLLKLSTRSGALKPVIDKAVVDLNGAPFQKLAKHRTDWMWHCNYINTGPIQFYGDPSLTDSYPLILGIR